MDHRAIGDVLSLELLYKRLCEILNKKFDALDPSNVVKYIDILDSMLSQAIKAVVDLIMASVTTVPFTGGTTRPRQRTVILLSIVLMVMSKSAEARRDSASVLTFIVTTEMRWNS